MTVVVPVQADTRKAEQNLAQVTKSVKGLETTANNTARNIRRAFIGIGTVITANLSIGAIGRISTEFTNLGNRIAVVTGRTQELGRAQRELFRISEQTRSSIGTTVETFGVFGRSLRESQFSTEQILEVTKSIQKTIALSGAPAESARSAIIQLGQGLGAGQLRGQELVAVLEQLPRAAIAIADGLDVPLGKLKALGEQGQLTSEQVFEALLSQTSKIDQEFKNVNPTIEQSRNLLIDGVKIWVNELDQGLGLSARTGEVLIGWSKSVREASENAFDLGTRIAFSFNIIKRDVKRIISPFARILIELGKQFLDIVPAGFLTTTLEAEINKSIREFDKFLGGPIAAFKRFKFIDIIKIESDVELAIRRLRRLSPRYWAASGFDVLTIRDFLSLDNFNLYIESFEDLADAIAKNTNSIARDLRKFVINFRFEIQNLATFLGVLPDTLVSIRAGNLRSFNKTIIELVRGIGNVSLTIFNLSELLEDVLAPSFTRIFKALLDVADKFFNSFTSLLDPLRIVLDFLREFATRVILIFAGIYYQVIGGSWWTDTIEGIVDSSNNLWERSRAGLIRFRDNVTNLFSDIFRKNRNNSFEDLIGSLKENIPGLKSKGFFDSLVDQINDVFDYINNKFPTVVTAAFVAIGGLLVSLLFPASAIKNAILTSVVLALVKAGTVIAEVLSNSLLDLSVVNNIAASTGKAVGVFLSSIIRDLPKTLNIIFGALSNFIRGVIEQIPLIGAAFRGIFNVADIFGLAGPVGLIGGLLLGKLTFSILTTKTKDIFKNVGNAFKSFGAQIIGRNKDGIFSRFLFGPLGPARSIGLVGLILDQLGLFDSIFQDSALAQLVVQGGLFYLLVTGGKGVGAAADFIGKQFIFPLGKKLAIFASQSAIGARIFEAFFGVTGGVGDRFVLLIRDAIKAASAVITNFAARGIVTATPFITEFLFGSDPASTQAGALSQFKTLFSAVRDQISRFVGFVLKTNIVQAIFNFSAASSLLDPLKNAFISFSNFFTGSLGSLKAKSLAIGGKDGLIGRAMFGLSGKRVLFTAILAAFAIFVNTANAAEDELASASETGFFSGLFDSLNKLSRENPLLTALIPTTIVALLAFRRQILGILLSAFPTSITKNFEKTSVKSFKNISRIFRSVIGGIGGSIIGGDLARRIGPEFEIIGVIAGAALGEGILKGALKALKSSIVLRIGGGILAAIFSIKAAIVAAIGGLITAVGGLLYVLFFGETGNFSKDLDTAINKIKEFLGLAEKDVGQINTGLSEAAQAFANFQRLGLEFSIAGIDEDLISDREQNKLEERIKELNDTILRARDEEETTGRISQELRNSIDALDRGLVRYTDKLRERSEIDFNDATRILESFRNLNPSNLFDRIALGFEQIFLDISFDFTKIFLNIQKLFGSESAAADLEILLSLKDTDFNSRFAGLDPSIERIIELRKELESLGELKGIDDDLAARVQEQTQKVIKILEEGPTGIQGTTRGRSGIIRNRIGILASISTPIVERDRAVQDLTESLEAAIAAQERLIAVKDFRSELTKISRGLKDVGLSFDAENLFVNETEFKRLSDLSQQAAFNAADRLANVGNAEELKRVNLTALRIRREVEEILQNAELADLKTQQAAAVLLNKISEDTFSDQTIQRLSSDVADRIRQLVTEIQTAEQSIKIQVELDTEQSEVQAERLQADIVSKTQEIERIILQEGGFKALSEFAENLSIDLNNAFRRFDVSFIVDALDQIRVKANEVELIKDSDPIKAANLRNEIELIVDKLNETPKTINDILSSVSSLGSTFTLNDLVSLSPGTLEQFKEIASSLDEIDKAISLKGESITDSEVAAIAQKRAELVRLINEKELELLFSTAQKKIDALSNKGVDAELIPFLSDSSINSLLDAERTAKQIGIELSKASNADQFRELARQLANIEQPKLFDRRDIAKAVTEAQRANIANLSQSEQLDIIVRAFPLLRDFRNLLEELPFSDLSKLLNDAINFTDRVTQADLGGTEFSVEEQIKAIDEAQGGISGALERVEFGAATREFAARLGRDLDKESFNLVNSINRVYIDSLLDEISRAQTILDTPGISEEARISAQLLLNSKSRELDRGIERASLDTTLISEQAGFDFANNVVDGFGNAINDAIRGVQEEGKSTWVTFRDALVNTFTNEVINSFIDGAIEAIRNSEIFDKLAELGKSVFEQLFLSLLSALGPGAGFGGGSGAFDPSVNFGGNRAEGGIIKGPGTGTSDSILAMLSNGEFVVNAAATKKNKDLLELINSNRIEKFASGGSVGSVPVSTTAITGSNNVENNKSQQVFNLNITGDISNQTKQEIFKMLPEISKGVNSYNYERRFK